METKSSLAYHTTCIALNRCILRFPIIVIFLMLFTLLQSKEAKAQNFNPLISFSVESCTLDVALENLLAEYDINVAFSKADLSKIRIEKYSCSYKSSEEVLADLLKGTNYGFRKIGKQYVIRKNKAVEPSQNDNSEPEDPISEITKHKTETIMDKTGDTIRVFDTMQVIRTVMRYDTIVRYDSIFTVDTVFDIKYKGYEIKWPKFKDNGWFISPSLSYGIAKYFTTCNILADDTKLDIEKNSVVNASIDGGYKHDRWSAGMTLSFRSVRYRFLFDETFYEGDYYVNDTLDTYYVTYPTGDTSYYYIIDSTYMPLETTLNSYRDVNRINYLGLGAFLTIDIYHNDHARLFAKIAATLEIPCLAEGSTLNADGAMGRALSIDDVASPKFSYLLGIGAAVKVSNRIELVPELFYRKTIGNLYTNNSPIDLRTELGGLKLGLTYYF